MGQIASAAASKDESHVGMDSSGEESSDEETVSASQDIKYIQETPRSQSNSTRLIKPLGIEEVLLQLQNLSTEDLEKRIDMASLTRDNILEFTQSHREDLAAMNDKYANTALSRDFEENVALRILDLSSNLRYLRFKLVSKSYITLEKSIHLSFLRNMIHAFLIELRYRQR
jgi:flagellar motor protein MotB